MRRMKRGQKDDEEDEGRQSWGEGWTWRRKMKSKEELQAACQQHSRKSVLHEE